MNFLEDSRGIVHLVSMIIHKGNTKRWTGESKRIKTPKENISNQEGYRMAANVKLP